MRESVCVCVCVCVVVCALREGRRKGGREGGREGVCVCVCVCVCVLSSVLFISTVYPSLLCPPSSFVSYLGQEDDAVVLALLGPFHNHAH